MTRTRKVVLWAGPKDGEEVPVEEGVLQYFFPDTLQGKMDPKKPIAGVEPRKVTGRYQFNSMTQRFEWMGYE